MIRSIEKLKVRIDQNLNRAEKSEAFKEDVVKVENKVTSLKQVCQNLNKKIAEGTSATKGNDGAAVEKRIRKTSEFILGQTFQESGRAYLRHEIISKGGSGGGGGAELPAAGGPFSQFLFDSGNLLNDLASSQVSYEIGVEKLVLNALTTLVDDHIPQLTKDKKLLNSLILDYDAAKSRLVSYRTKEGSQSSHLGASYSSSNNVEISSADVREEKLQNELAELGSKVSSARDSIETQMHAFLSREAEIGRILLKYFELKQDYHRKVAERIAKDEQNFRDLLESAITPVFGTDLEQHLKKNSSRIAIPIRLCVCRLLQLDICEEGLFRVAAPAVKIRRLASLLDTGDCTDEQLSEITDPHVFAGTLKLYLRQLPTPLLNPYSKWITVALSPPDRRRDVIYSLLHNLPQVFRDNLHYLLRFFNLVSSHSESNRMTASNLSIVLAPNLLWNPEGAVNGADSSSLSHTNIINDIVESLISDVDWYFESRNNEVCEIEFFFQETKLEPPRQIVAYLKRSGSGASKSDSPSSPALGRTPVPKPRQSRPRTAPPPPKPAERQSIQISDSTNL